MKLDLAIRKEQTSRSDILNSFFSSIRNVFCVAAIGLLAGSILSRNIKITSIDYGSIDSDSLEDDIEEIYNRYLKIDDNDYSTFSPSEMVNIATYKYQNEKYTYSDIVSTATSMGITQYIYGTTIKNDSDYFNESITESSFVKTAKRFYQNEDVVDIYNGKINHADGKIFATYDLEETFNIDSFVDKWGKDLRKPLIYTISSKTCLNTSSYTIDQNGNYLVSLDLDPIKSVSRYVKQMVEMSGLSSMPEFESIHLDFTLSNELDLLKMEVSENYYVWVVGKNYTKGSLTETFHILDDFKEIPDFESEIYYEE